MTELVVTEADDGKILPARVGASLVLNLRETPSSGYRWAFDALDESHVAVEGSSWAGADAQPGAGGVASWRLCPLAAGRTRLALKRWRHWEGEKSVVERFSVVLDVKPA